MVIDKVMYISKVMPKSSIISNISFFDITLIHEITHIILCPILDFQANTLTNTNSVHMISCIAYTAYELSITHTQGRNEDMVSAFVERGQ